jgi:hypothetical protein
MKPSTKKIPSPSPGLLRIIATAAVALPLLNCGGGGGGNSGNSSGTLNLAITDGTIDAASSLVVQFTGVQLQPSGGGNVITFNFSSPKQIDLLTLQKGNAASLLSGASVPAGNYDWIRLTLNVGSNQAVANSYIDINGAQYPLILPSGEQTGLKLVQGFTMTANQVANFTIDFVLEQAVTAPPGQQIGGVQAYLLRPALRLIDNVQAGTISGTVALSTLQARSPSCFDSSGNSTAHVYIFSGAGATFTDIQIDPTTGLPPAGHSNPVVTAPVTYASATGQYGYMQPFLLAGTYTLAVACGTDNPSTADTLAFIPAAGLTTTVSANQTTTVNF